MTKKTKYQIDQSGKVENTSVKTIVAYSNGTNFSVEISAKDKRRLQEQFRRIGEPTIFVYITFASLICLLINKRITHINIDLEYPGHDKILTKMIKTVHPNITISWMKIGKSSNAHKVAYNTYKQRLRSKKKVKAKEVWEVAKKIASERLNGRMVTSNRRPGLTTYKNYTKGNLKSQFRK
jgi:hypothetical protein